MIRESCHSTLLRGGTITITRTVHDPRGLALSVWVGTNDTGATDDDPTGGGAPGNNMVAVQINQFDGGAGTGDGNLTLQTLPVDGNSANNRVTGMEYDWRNRQVQVNSAQDDYVVNTFDTLNRVVQVDRHAQATGNQEGNGYWFARRHIGSFHYAGYAVCRLDQRYECCCGLYNSGSCLCDDTEAVAPTPDAVAASHISRARLSRLCSA